MHLRMKNRREEKKRVGSAGNRKGMLYWRTGRGKPQEGMRGREEETEGSKKITRRGKQPDQGTEKQMFLERGGQTP